MRFIIEPPLPCPNSTVSSIFSSLDLDEFAGGGHNQPSGLNSLGAQDKVRHILNLAGFPFKDNHFKAVVFVDVHMDRRDDAIEITMLNKVQLFLQIARMVAVDDGERAHDDTSRRCALPFHQRIAHEIANDFAAVLRKTATRNKMVEVDKKVFGIATEKRTRSLLIPIAFALN